jgi:fission process protein 1
MSVDTTSAATRITDEDLAMLTKHYDANRDGHLTETEIATLVSDCRTHPDSIPAGVRAVLVKYDSNADGKFDASEIKVLVKDIKFAEGNLRYAGYTAGLAKMSRYLAFTSDLGEALRPVVATNLVRSSYGVAAGYCVADVSYEAYKLKKNNYIHRDGRTCTLGQVVAERATFQLVASLTIPFLVIHSAVGVSSKLFDKVKPLQRFKRFGPSIVGLCAIPLLPLYLDEPVERGLESMFHRLAQWRAGAAGTAAGKSEGVETGKKKAA